MVAGLLLVTAFAFAGDDKPSYEYEMGGRFMLDMGWLSGDGSWDGMAPSEWRRARFYGKGTIYDHIEFKIQLDFAGGDADWKDMYLKLKKLPFNITVGHFKEPFGLEELTSSKYITFIERSLPIEAFSPSRNLGIMFDTNMADKLLWLGLGIFRDAGDYGTPSYDEDIYNFTGRLAMTPMYDKKKGNVLHLGIGFSARNYDGNSLRYRSRPGVHYTDRIVNTDKFAADASTLLGLEAAAQFGSFSLQGEYISASTDGTTVGDPAFSGLYVQASYWLTGESRAYKNSSKKFDRVKPKESFGKGGMGAFELAARYAMLDLNDGNIMGGDVNNFTIGLNWHLTPYTRIMVNFVTAEEEIIGNFSAFALRFQQDFKIKWSK